jgi:H/ACA ribonucleoprotein complex non-core subunit NAF1
MDGFKIPSDLPQDLLLIQELVGHSPDPQQSPHAETGPSLVDDDCIDCSDSGSIASEDEIAADLVGIGETASIELNQYVARVFLSFFYVEGARCRASTAASRDGSDTSSDCDSEVAADGDPSVEIKMQDQCDIGDEDDEEDSSSPNVASRISFQTKNEVAITEISIPDVQAIGPEEELEKVGEILNIIDDFAIVKGTGSGVNDNALDRVLDSDTLLVFENRTVMGYVRVHARGSAIH